jgi:hypothetical protein
MENSTTATETPAVTETAAPEAAATPEAKPAAKPAAPPRVDAETFVNGFRDVANGTATFTDKSKPCGPIKTIVVGASVPVSRNGVAALLGMKYNAAVNREKAYREKGVKLPEIKLSQRGASLDVASLNALLVDAEVVEQAVAEPTTETVSDQG